MRKIVSTVSWLPLICYWVLYSPDSFSYRGSHFQSEGGVCYQLWRSSPWVPLLGAIAGCHCWVPCWGAIAGCHCSVPLLGAIAGVSRWVPLLGAIAGVPLLGCHCLGCHCWVPLLGSLLGCHCWGAIAGCHCWVPLLGCHCWVPLWGAMAGCHCWVPLLGCHCEKTLTRVQSVTPFSAAPFSALITNKLACAIWGVCWYNLGWLFFWCFCLFACFFVFLGHLPSHRVVASCPLCFSPLFCWIADFCPCDRGVQESVDCICANM